MSIAQQSITILIVALATMFTRFLPFLLFPSGRPIPPYIQYLGRVLPGAMLGLLAVYSLRTVSLFSGNYGVPELLSTAIVVLLHIWRRQMLLSIMGGTLCYILLIQLVF